MRRKIAGISLAGLFCLLSLPTQAAIINFTSVLSPGNEVPPVTGAEGASGGAGIVYNDTTMELSWSIAFEGLTANASAAHIHSQAPSQLVGPPAINLDSGLNNEADDAFIGLSGLGLQSGVFLGVGPLSVGQEAELMAGRLYINIHTANNPGGEIRGQILPATVVPVPAAVWLFGSGILGLVGLARRKKAA